ADALTRSQTMGARTAARLNRDRGTSYEEAERLSRTRSAVLGNAPALSHTREARYEEADRTRASRLALLTFEYAAFVDWSNRTGWEQADSLSYMLDDGFTQGPRLYTLTRGRYEEAINPPPGTGEGPTDPPEPPRIWPTELRFCEMVAGHPSPVTLIFGVDPCAPVLPPGAIIIPTQEIYVVSNSASMRRVSDGADIPCQAVTLSTSMAGFAWEMTATMAGRDALELVRGASFEPEEIDVTINGFTWRIVVDDWNTSEAASTKTATVRGRSRSAYLAAPYAALSDGQETSARLAAQLIDDQLPIGWNLANTMDDWLVAANAFTWNQQSPIQIIQRIASAGGAYVQTNRSLDEIIVAPRFAAAPWNWAGLTPDISVPSAYVVQRGSQKVAGTGANGVYMHGGNNGGVLSLVRKDGTAGDQLAPTVVDDLFTHVDPTRNAGIVAIANTSRQSRETHQLPLSAMYGGLLEVGQLMAVGEDSGGFVEDWRGLVTGVSVNARADRDGRGGVRLQVRQTVSVERHYE
ncbi:MAG: hypothetical protein AAF845_20735, partial [Bacteroidota bacterium]